MTSGGTLLAHHRIAQSGRADEDEYEDLHFSASPSSPSSSSSSSSPNNRYPHPLLLPPPHSLPIFTHTTHPPTSQKSPPSPNMLPYDPPFLFWGFQDFLEPYSVAGVGRTSVQLNDHSRTEFFEPEESYTVRGYSSFENDEVVADTLQVDEGFESPRYWGEHSQTDIWQEDYGLDSTYDDYGSGREYNSDEMPEISEDFAAFDGEVGRILNNMDSIPHVPRVNGEIPTLDDASAAHQRLLDRLMIYGLRELKVDGDGNCQFRAFSDQLYRTSMHHKSIRNDVVNQLISHPEFYEGYVPMKYNEYVKKMSRSGEWGDHVTLQAAADFYGVSICLLTSFKETCFIQILPKQAKSKRVIFLSFWAEVHYNSVYPGAGEDVPSDGGTKKKSGAWDYIKNKLRI